MIGWSAGRQTAETAKIRVRPASHASIWFQGISEPSSAPTCRPPHRGRSGPGIPEPAAPRLANSSRTITSRLGAAFRLKLISRIPARQAIISCRQLQQQRRAGQQRAHRGCFSDVGKALIVHGASAPVLPGTDVYVRSRRRSDSSLSGQLQSETQLFLFGLHNPKA